MDITSPVGPAWTRQRVEARLVAAFRLMPHVPLYGSGSARMRTADGERSALTEALAWGALLRHDPDGHQALWAWARCKANREPFSEYVSARGWSRSTAEDGRRRAAAAIAAALNGRGGSGAVPATPPPGPTKPLDSRKTAPASSAHPALSCSP